MTRERYDEELRAMQRALDCAIDVSIASGGIDTSTRFIIATQAFTRMVVGAYSFVRLLPGNSITNDEIEFWDWPTIACVARNILETYHIFHYLVNAHLTQDEIDFRVLLMHFHRNMEKYKLYKEWGAESEVLESFDEGLPEASARLESHVMFQRLPPKVRQDILAGRRMLHLSNAEIGESLPFMNRHFRPIYRLFSNQVHTTPFSFQVQSNIRGRGNENDAERFYIVLAIQVVVQYLTAAVLDMARVHPTEVGAGCASQVAVAHELHEAE